MSDITQGAELTPRENAYFESKGQTLPDAPPPPATEAPSETPPQETTTAEPQPREPAKTVPISALHEERTARQDLERKFREIELENARWRERAEIVARATQQQERPPPKPEEDIFGALNHTGRRLEQVEKMLQDNQRTQQQDAQHNQVVNAYVADAQRVARDKPDFADAYTHLLETRDRELQAMGYTDPIMRQKARQNDEFTVVTIAMQNGISPAEAIYNLAVARGFQAGKAKNGNGAADKLATVKQGQEANRSLSAAGGTAGAEEMSAERLLKMPLDEFEAWTNKNPRKARQLMGG